MSYVWIEACDLNSHFEILLKNYFRTSALTRKALRADLNEQLLIYENFPGNEQLLILKKDK